MTPLQQRKNALSNLERLLDQLPAVTAIYLIAETSKHARRIIKIANESTGAARSPAVMPVESVGQGGIQ